MECPTKTYARFNNLRWVQDANGEYHQEGGWEDVKSNEYVATYFDDSKRYFTLSISQERYIVDLAQQYQAVNPGTTN
jgi:hypothetical protein